MKKAYILLGLIILLGFSLRVTGIDWGLTTTKYFHAASYYPEEGETFNAIRNFKPSKLDFRVTGHFLSTRGSFHIYCTAFWLKASSMLGFINLSQSFDYFKTNPMELAKIYMSARSMSVFFGTLTIFMVFMLTKLYFKSVPTALLASLIFAITPLHSVWSHYLSTDALLLFIICSVFLASYYIINEDRTKYYIFAGLLIGISGATKFNMVPIFLVPVAAHLLSGRKTTLRIISAYLLACFAGFLFGNPYAAIDPSAFIKTLKWSAEFNIAMNPRTQIMDAFGCRPNLIYYITTAPRYSFGIPLYVLFISGFFFSIYKREKADILMLFWALSYYIFISLLSPWQVMRWQLPYVPFLCIFAARFIIAASENKNRVISKGVISLSAIALLLTLFYTTAYVKTMAEKDIRDLSSEWIEQNIPEGSSIGSSCVYFWNPSIVMTEYWYKKNEPVYNGLKKYKMLQVIDKPMLEKTMPDYMILTNFEYHTLLKIKYLYPHPETYPYLLAIMNEGKYTLVHTFTKEPELFGIRPVNGFYPHEFRWVFPEIKVYKRVKN